jgi:hypothetical protein
LATDIQRELTDRLQKGHRLDVADGAANLGDDHVYIVCGQLADGLLDLVGDVRDDLHGAAAVVAAPLFLDDRHINLAGGEGAVAGQGGVGEAFVVAEVEVGLRAVVQHIDFAVLIGTHRARIDVDVGVELLQPHAQAAPLQQHAHRGAGDALAQ